MTDVLLLHGQPGTGGDWAGVAASLRERGLRVTCPDRPGYGTSAFPAGGFEHNARAIAGLLDGPAVVAGYSWAAGIALSMAARYPDKLRAIVLVCPVTPDGRLGRLDRAMAGRRAGPLMARAGFLWAGAALTVPPLRRRIAPLVPGADASRWPELRRAWRTFWVEQRALVDELPGLDASFDVPATFVLGERDHVTDPTAARAYAARLGADVIEVAGVGHLLPMQRPAEVARAIEGASGASSGGP